jgi:hypothetical protein
MSIRTTIDIPEDVCETLRRKAADEKTSIRALVVNAIDAKFNRTEPRIPMTGPPVPGRGKSGPLCPDKENPYDFIFA